MTMAVTGGRVGAHHVDIAPAGRVPQIGALSAIEHDRKRLVVVRTVEVLELGGVHGCSPADVPGLFDVIASGGICGGSDPAPRPNRRSRSLAAAETAVVIDVAKAGRDQSRRCARRDSG